MNIFVDEKYFQNLRDEVFSKDPFQLFIDSFTPEEGKIFTKQNWFLTETYDWNTIENKLRALIRICGEIPSGKQSTVLMEGWKMIPHYLKNYSKFHDDVKEYPAFEIMHKILTNAPVIISMNQLCNTPLLPKGKYFCLDTGFVILNTPLIGFPALYPHAYMFNGMVSSRKSKLIRAIKVLEDNTWPNTNNVLSEIKGKKRKSKYYNLETGKIISRYEIRKLAFHSDEHKIASDDAHFFQHIISNLEQPSLRQFFL